MSKNISIGLVATIVISLTIAVLTPNAIGRSPDQKAQRQSRDTPKSQNRASPKSPSRTIKYPAVGQRIQTLPKHHQIIRMGRDSYRYHSGVFYRPGPKGVYVVVRAPLGARVRYLPSGYISFFIGPRRYFYVNLTYYLWDIKTEEYVIVEEPDGAESAVVTASESAYGEIFVYPNRGQSDELRESDRYACYLWAVEQTGFDPGAANPELNKAGAYRRAISACLEGRGYTVK